MATWTLLSDGSMECILPDHSGRTIGRLPNEAIRHFSKVLLRRLQGQINYRWVETEAMLRSLRPSPAFGTLTLHNLRDVLRGNPMIHESEWRGKRWLRAVWNCQEEVLTEESRMFFVNTLTLFLSVGFRHEWAETATVLALVPTGTTHGTLTMDNLEQVLARSPTLLRTEIDGQDMLRAVRMTEELPPPQM
jgi:hypothetical protein